MTPESLLLMAWLDEAEAPQWVVDGVADALPKIESGAREQYRAMQPKPLTPRLVGTCTIPGCRCGWPETQTPPRTGLPRLTHGRHCRCTPCKRTDWTDPSLAHCGMHGPSCPPVYDPYPVPQLTPPTERCAFTYTDATGKSAVCDASRDGHDDDPFVSTVNPHMYSAVDVDRLARALHQSTVDRFGDCPTRNRREHDAAHVAHAEAIARAYAAFALPSVSPVTASQEAGK